MRSEDFIGIGHK